MIQSLPIGDVDERTATMKYWQRRHCFPLSLRLKQKTQRRFDQLGHCPALPRCFTPQLSHDRVVDIQRGLHMGSHIIYMEVRLALGRGRCGPPGKRGGIGCCAGAQSSNLNQLQCLPACVLVLPQDDVIVDVVDGDAEWPRDLDDGLRHLNLGARRRRVAYWGR